MELFLSQCILKNHIMTKIILVGLLFISLSTALAQPIPPRSIEDSVIGWKSSENDHYYVSNIKITKD